MATGIIQYQKYFPPLYDSVSDNSAPSLRITRGQFLSDTLFYIGNWGQGFNKNQVSPTTPDYGSSGSKRKGFVLSSEISKSCYLKNSDVPTQVTATPGSAFQTMDSMGTTYQVVTDITLVLSKTTDPKVTDIDDSKLDGKDWCEFYQEKIVPLTYASTLTYSGLSTAAKTFLLTPVPSYFGIITGFISRYVCDGTAAGAFSYKLQTDFGVAIPSHISVDSATGKVTIAANSPSGTFRIRLYGETATTHQYYWIYYDIIGTV